MAGLIDFADIMVGDPLVDVGHVLASEEGRPGPAALVLRGWGVVDLLTRDSVHHNAARVDAAIIVYAAWFLLWRAVGVEEGEAGEDDEVPRTCHGRHFTAASLQVQAVLRLLAGWASLNQPSVCGLALEAAG